MPEGRAEQARAVLLELFPQGFEEHDADGAVELAAYTDADGEERLRKVFGTVAAVGVEDGWETRWREFHRGVRVGPLWVGPPWEQAPRDALAVVIDPGQAFGTGAHATTRLCLELLVDSPRGSLADVGCGSGVLSIAAAKLGFRPVFAVDNDPVAVRVTRENLAVNGVEAEAILADALAGGLPEADLAVANVTLAGIVGLVPHVSSARLVTSGYLIGDDVALNGFRHVRRRDLDGWVADVWERI